MNDHTFIINGKASTGKTRSLKNLKNPQGVMYLNTEPKRVNFKTNFWRPEKDASCDIKITDPYEVIEALEVADSTPEIHTVVIDSLTMLIAQYETQYVNTAQDTRKAWGDYGAFIMDLLINKVNECSKNIIFIAHTYDVLDEKSKSLDTKIPVKGAISNLGIESFFNTIVSTKKISVGLVEKNMCEENPHLTLTKKERDSGYKVVFQTSIDGASKNEKMRSPEDLWGEKELYVNAEAQIVLDKLEEYYK